MENIFFVSWDSILRVVAITPMIYLLVIFYIRVIGKRSTSQMNNFDWIVTVAMGSIVASTIILKNVSFLDGAISVLLMLVLQYGITKLMVYSSSLRKLVRSNPTLLLYEGKFIKENMKSERVLEAEVFAEIREKGLKNKNQVHAVVLETDARISVIPKSDNDEKCFSLANVSGLPEELTAELKNDEYHRKYVN